VAGTERRPADRVGDAQQDAFREPQQADVSAPTEDEATGAQGHEVAPAPLQTPAPPVTHRVEDTLVAQQESAAAAEAASIGGLAPADSGDPALDPVYQAGGGEQEGWEAAEAELIENATHGEGHGDPEGDAFTPEAESDRASAVYGEGDRLPSTETVEDPSTGGNDPASGPNLDAERGPRPRRRQKRSRASEG